MGPSNACARLVQEIEQEEERIRKYKAFNECSVDGAPIIKD